MKKEKENERKAESQNRFSIKDAYTDQFKLYAWVSSNYEMPQITPPLEGQGGGFTVGKGPPGRSRSPDLIDDHPPDNKAGPLVGNINYNNECQLVNKYQNSILFNFLIFLS